MLWMRLNNSFQKEFALTIDTFNKVNLFFCFVCMILATLNYNKKLCLCRAVRGNTMQTTLVSAWSFSLVVCEVLIGHKIVASNSCIDAPSCGMFVYKDSTSQVNYQCPWWKCVFIQLIPLVYGESRYRP